VVKSLDLIDYILLGLVPQMNIPGVSYNIDDAALVSGVCAALKIDPAAVWARLAAHCHVSTTTIH
jgi:hypothetical protein